MRTVRISVTAENSLTAMLVDGAAHYSLPFLEAQRSRVYATILRTIAQFPDMRPQNVNFDGLRLLSIKHTPFTVVYDFDDAEVRILQVLHRRAAMTRARALNIEW
jgi:plasmid stabilization system protein ParE